MKFNREKLLQRHIATGFLLGMLFVIPEMIFLYLKKTNAHFAPLSQFKLSIIILGTCPFVLAYICFHFGKVRVSLIQSNEKLKMNEKERLSLMEELFEYKHALDHSSIVTVIDEHGKIKRTNKNFELLTGYDSTYLKGRSIWRLPSSAQRGEVFNNIKNVTDAGKVWNGELVYNKKNGDTCYTKAIVVPLSEKKEGNNDCLVIQYDITKEKNAELALRKIEEERSIILDNTQTLICAHDVNGKLLNINKAGARILGCEPEQVIGKCISDFLGQNAVMEQYLKDTMDNGSSEGFFKVIGKNGESRALLYKNMVSQKQDEPYVIGSAIDITDTIRAKRRIGKPKDLYQFIDR